MSSTEKRMSFRDMFIPALKGFIIGIITAAVLLPVLSAAAYFSPVPDMLTRIFGYGVLYISAAVMGAVAIRLWGESDGSGVFCSVISGIFLLLLLLVMSLLPAESTGDITALTRILMYVSIPVSSAIAGIIFKPRRHKAKHRRRR